MIRIEMPRFAMFIARSGLFTIALCASSAYGQAGFRQSLERLDTNHDGEIEPDEITPLARPYLEKIAEARRISLDRPNRIDRLQEASRIYHAIQNGASNDRIRPEPQGSVMPFGRLDDETLIPEFGLPQLKFQYTQEDLDEARRTLKSHDRNRDGVIDRAEAMDSKWTHRDPWEDDLNGDDRLSRLELAQRYARRRLVDDDRDEIIQRIRRVGNGIESSIPERNRQEDDSQWWRKGGNSYWLAASVLSRFDANKNGRLESTEIKSLGLPITQIDIDRDGELTREELYAFLDPVQKQAAGEYQGIPGWFYELDTNQDNQVDMAEFTNEWSQERLQEFVSLDINQDGLLTAFEVSHAKSMVGGSYTNELAEVLPPGRTVISEIEVSEDFLIGDLNVQLSITHTSVGLLDAHLIGPSGQRVELFTEVGGSDDHFDQTIFDDQSSYPITKARAPFNGTFLPEAILKREPSLSSFNGTSIRGIWQLIIRGTRNDRFGMLHRWSLLVKPQEKLIGGIAVVPAEDGPRVETDAAAWPMERTSEMAQERSDPRQQTAYPESFRRSPQDLADFSNQMKDAVQAGKLTSEEARMKWKEFAAADSKGDGRDDRHERDREKDRDNFKLELKREKSEMSREEIIERIKAMQRG